jgi:dipeptidyl aminopeptidase/acylaminoacyl peptidase
VSNSLSFPFPANLTSTGSTSFGSAFTYAVAGDWGGRPYQDLENCFTYVSSKLQFVDTSRAIAAGGSYGGYMMNFIAGQPLAKKFKTLICHDGIFNFVSMLATDHPAEIKDMFHRPPWKALDAEPLDEFCPSRNMCNWSTPMLFIHSDKDYRCPVTQGLMAYNVCQLRRIDSRFLNFPDENHFVLKRENSYRWYLTVLGWANKYAGNEGEGKIRLEEPVTKPKARETGDKYRVEGTTGAKVD